MPRPQSSQTQSQERGSSHGSLSGRGPRARGAGDRSWVTAESEAKDSRLQPSAASRVCWRFKSGLLTSVSGFQAYLSLEGTDQTQGENLQQGRTQKTESKHTSQSKTAGAARLGSGRARRPHCSSAGPRKSGVRMHSADAARCDGCREAKGCLDGVAAGFVPSRGVFRWAAAGLAL